MSKKICCGLTLVAVLVLGVWTFTLRAQAPREKEAQGAPFAGKVVLVWCKPSSSSGVLKKPEFRTIGGRSFLVGKSIENNFTKNNFPGSKVWLPLEDVQQIVEFEDQQQLEKQFGTAK